MFEAFYRRPFGGGPTEFGGLFNAMLPFTTPLPAFVLAGAPDVDFDLEGLRFYGKRRTSKSFGGILDRLGGKVVRPSLAWSEDRWGNLVVAQSNEPRFDWKGGVRAFLSEDEATNLIRNNTLVGASAGSPGVLPNNWLWQLVAGLTANVVSVTTVKGRERLRVRVSGTPTASGASVLNFDTTNGVPAANGQTLTTSMLFCIVDSPAPPENHRFRNIGRQSNGTPATNQGFESVFDPARGDMRREAHTFTMSDAAVAAVQPGYQFVVVSGKAVDFTFDVSLPQTELGSYATSHMKTSGAAFTRKADEPDLPFAQDGEHTLFVDYEPLGFDPSIRSVVSLDGFDGTSQATASANRSHLRVISGGTNFVAIAGGAAQINIGHGGLPAPYVGRRRDVGVAMVAPGSRNYQNGLTGTADAGSNTLPATRRLAIGFGGGQKGFQGRIYRIAVFTRALSAAEVAAISAEPGLVKPAWVPVDAVHVADFLGHYYKGASQAAKSFEEWLARNGGTFSRLSGGYRWNMKRELEYVPPDKARLDCFMGVPSLLYEGETRNLVRNPRGEGGTPGVLGSGGSPPSTHNFPIIVGMTVEYLGQFYENGVPFNRVRYSGTPTNAGSSAAARICMENGAQSVPASSTITISSFVRMFAGSAAGVAGMDLRIQPGGSAEASGNEVSAAVLAAGNRRLPDCRFAHTRTYDANLTDVRPLLRVQFTQGVASDITLDIGLTQMEIGADASTPVMPPVGQPGQSVCAAEGLSFPYAQSGAHTLMADFSQSFLGVNTGQVVGLTTGAAPRSRIYTDASGSTAFIIADANATQAQAVIGAGSFGAGRRTAVVAANTNDAAWFSDGVKRGTDASVILPATTTLAFGSAGGGAGGAFRLYRFAMIPRRLSDAEAIALTAAAERVAPAWAVPGASMSLDMLGQRFQAHNNETQGFGFFGSMLGLTVSRLGTATRFNEDGVLEDVEADIPRFNYDPATLNPRGMLVEPSRQNFNRNSVLAGASVGAPGTLPSNWGRFAASGLTWSVASRVNIKGVEWIGLRLFGTATGAGNSAVQMETNVGAPAANGQNWAHSFFHMLGGGDTTNVSAIQAFLNFQASGGGFSSAPPNVSFLPSAVIGRVVQQATINDANAAFIRGGLNVNTVAGPVDITIMVALPQMEQGVGATSPIKTSGSALGRAADIVTMPLGSWFNGSEGTIVLEATQEAVAPGSHYARFSNIGAQGGGTTNYIGFRQSNNGLQVLGQIAVGGSVSPGVGNTNYALGVPNRMAVAFKIQEWAGATDGGAVSAFPNHPTTTAPMTRLDFGDGGHPVHIRSLDVLPIRAANANLPALSTKAA